MLMALWELAPPIFLGTFLAIVAILALMNKHHKLLRGPRRLANALFRHHRDGCKPGCTCGACGCARATAQRARRSSRERYGSCGAK